jgi:hypothetical protein
VLAQRIAGTQQDTPFGTLFPKNSERPQTAIHDVSVAEQRFAK